MPFRNLTDSFKPPKRRHPLDLLYKRMFKDRIEVQIPKGMQLAGLPKNVMYEDEYFKLERLAQIEGDRLVAVYTMVQKVLNVSPEKYPAARKSFHKALDARSFVLLFEPEKKKKS